MTINQESLAIVILAAGKGTRMKSDLPKVLHPLKEQPLVQHVIQTARQLNPTGIALVIGYKATEVQSAIGPNVLYALQTQQLGTGHAVAQAKDVLKAHPGLILILYGDMPLITSQTLHELVSLQRTNPGPLSMLTVIADNPRGFGRILRNEQDEVVAIVEEADCTPAQRHIKELNVGVYCIQGAWLWPSLAQITLSPKGEYYLTDLVAMAVAQGYHIRALQSTNLVETLGINTPAHLAEAEKFANN